MARFIGGFFDTNLNADQIRKVRTLGNGLDADVEVTYANGDKEIFSKDEHESLLVYLKNLYREPRTLIPAYPGFEILWIPDGVDEDASEAKIRREPVVAWQKADDGDTPGCDHAVGPISNSFITEAGIIGGLPGGGETAVLWPNGTVHGRDGHFANIAEWLEALRIARRTARQRVEERNEERTGTDD